MIEENEELRQIYDSIMREAFLESEKRVRYFTELDAKKRYMKFLDENKNLSGRVKQEFIASYLGITPSSLSRIKRQCNF